MTETATAYPWQCIRDGFSLCSVPLSEILECRGITDTGLSRINPADVESYFDDWHLYRVGKSCGLVKLREQERDYVPGFSDRDDPGVTVSFVTFRMEALDRLTEHSTPESPEVKDFLTTFRQATEYRFQPFDPILQAYFAKPESQGAYCIAEAYIKKLAALAKNGILPFPDGLNHPPKRIKTGLLALNHRAGREICDFQNKEIRLENSQNLTEEEKLCLLAAHTGNLSLNSFAAEVQFHAKALTAWESRIPIVGKRWWYASALRADMQVERDDPLRKLFFSDYYRENSTICCAQAACHGRK